MKAKGTTIKQATQEWVNEFNAIPQAIIEKLVKADCNEVNEITPPSKRDRVYICDGEHDGEYGEIVGTRYDGEDDLYEVHLDGAEDGNDLILAEDEFEVERDGGGAPDVGGDVGLRGLLRQLLAPGEGRAPEDGRLRLPHL